MAPLRRAGRITALLGSLLLCLPPHLLWRLFRRPSPWPRRFLGMAARSVGARVRVEGRPVDSDMFLVANHISWIDILALADATGAAFVAHDGIASRSPASWQCRHGR